MKRLVRSWQDTENHMIELDDEPTPKSEDDGGEGRQRDTDTAKEIADKLIKRMKDGEFNP